MVRKTDRVWRPSTGAVWIPDGATELQLRLAIIAHTGAAGQGVRAVT